MVTPPPPPLGAQRSPSRVRENNSSRKIEGHYRGRSLEGLRIKTNNDHDDLALFNDMQTKERDGFLHNLSGNESDDSLSVKLRDISGGFNIKIPTPLHNDRSELLDNETEKTDYDWLLTPPDTPLFPSLDDETPAANFLQRGRPRSQPIKISNPSKTENRARSARGSASPRRSSPTAPVASSMNRRRMSPGPVETIISPNTNMKSMTPALRRSSTGGGSPNGSACASTKPNRGKSLSPKLQSWHSNHPEFTAEPPPNLRTSMPAISTTAPGSGGRSRTRGSSPVPSSRGISPVSSSSRRGLSPVSTGRGVSPISMRRMSGGESRRHSVSPTTRSVCSSNSHDRDHLSSHSKGSAISSCDDDLDSIQSAFSGKKRVPISSIASAGRQPPRKQDSYPNSRISSFSRKPIRSTSTAHMPTNSAAKRSFDSTLRQMDLHRNSQSMFRPLLSSVPPTSFYTSKVNSPQGRTQSYISSVTTSSNASSDQGITIAIDTEGSEHNQDEVETSLIDTDDVKSSDGLSILPNGVYCDQNTLVIHTDVLNTSRSDKPKLGDKDSNTDTKECSVLGYEGNYVVQPEDIESNGTPDSVKTEVASVLHNDLASGNFIDIQMDVAVDRYSLNDCSNDTLESFKGATGRSLEIESKEKSSSIIKQQTATIKSAGKQDIQIFQQQSISAKQGSQGYSLPAQHTVYCEVLPTQEVPHSSNDNDNFTENLIRVASSQSAGVSSHEIPGKVPLEYRNELSQRHTSFNLLSRTSSCKWPTADAKACSNSELSDQSTQLRRSFNDLKMPRCEENSSTSCSTNTSSFTKHMEARISRQSSSKSHNTNKSSALFNVTVCGSSISSGPSSDPNQALTLNKASTKEADVGPFIDVFENSDCSQHDAEAINKSVMLGKEEDLTRETEKSVITKKLPWEIKGVEPENGCLDVSGQKKCFQSCEDSSLERQDFRHSLNENGEFHNDNHSSDESRRENVGRLEEADSRDNGQGRKTVESISDLASAEGDRSIHYLSGMDIPNKDSVQQVQAVESHDDAQNVQHENYSSVCQKDEEKVTADCSVLPSPEASIEGQDLKTNAEAGSGMTEPDNATQEDHANKVDVPKSYLSRNITFEEATDTILFCSSIVHDLAYKAVNIATEKENVPVEVCQPRMTVLGKMEAGYRASCAGSSARKPSRFHKIKSKQTAAHLQAPSNNIETNVKDQEAVMQVVSIPEKVEMPRPAKVENGNSKCNCIIM